MYRVVTTPGRLLAAALLTAVVVPAAGAMGDARPQRLDRARQLRVTGLAGSLQNPCWSPRGDRLALTRWTRRYNEGKAVVHVVPSTGGAPLATLSPTDAESVNLPGACWSAAGDVVFTSDVEEGDHVYVVSAEGGEPRRVTQPPQIAFEPTFSPDGEWIVFESHVRGDRGEIWKVRADGSALTRLTSGADDRQPSWAPKGELIVFQRHARGQVDLWTMDSTGRRLRNVTRTPDLEETDVSWSPSGRYLVFSGDGESVDLASLFTMRAGGGGRQQLTRTRGWYDGAPAWSRDGKRIAFEASPRDPDGSAGTRLWIIAAPSGRR